MQLDKTNAIKIGGAVLLLALVAVAVNDYLFSLQPYYFLNEDGSIRTTPQPSPQPDNTGFLPAGAPRSSGIPPLVLIGSIIIVALLLANYSLSQSRENKQKVLKTKVKRK